MINFDKTWRLDFQCLWWCLCFLCFWKFVKHDMINFDQTKIVPVRLVYIELQVLFSLFMTEKNMTQLVL